MNNELLHQFSATVEAIQAAALRPEAWTQAMQSIARLMRAPRALLFTPALAPQSGGFVMAHEVSEPFLIEWSNHYLVHDIWTQRAMEQGQIRDGNVAFGQELVPDTEFVQSIFYREFLSRQDIRKLCTGIVFAGQEHPNLPLTVCSVFRSNQCPDFEESDRGLHALIARHLSLAIGTMLRLRDTQFQLATSLQALDRLSNAILLLGQRGQVLFANREALALLAQSAGLSLRSGNPARDGMGWLQADNTGTQGALDAAIRAALNNDPLHPTHFSQGLRIPRSSSADDLLMQIVPAMDMPPLWGTAQPCAMAFIIDPPRMPDLDAALLQRLYRISAAECRVAQALLHGQTLQEIAERLHLGENTVKSHLKQLFAKTGTHRQPQLIQLLLKLTHAR